MNILLLGASGQLGREWQFFLKRQKDTDQIVFPYTSAQLDITQFEEVSKEIVERQPDVIINCAAYTRVDQAEEERHKARKINAEAVAHLAEKCNTHNAKLIHYSTDYVFPGTSEDRERYPDGYPEDHAVDPVNWYGQTKWEGEQAVRESGCEHLIIRTTWLCSRFGNNFVKTMLRLGAEKEELKVVNDQWGSPSFTEEVVRNTFALFEREATGTYHITSRGLTTWYKFAKTIFEYSGMDIDILSVSSEEFATKADRPKFSKLNTRKAEAAEGVQISHWKEGLKRLLNQIENH